ncbi:DMT family transporter [Flexithrix dorotheae]|uniref:DMT family transporter n=1 Tax=Flexithrix dorotheae TaxID=70993 RepID=UPI000475B0BC|nr:DMT family transporter [Flexithrix dorotheae]
MNKNIKHLLELNFATIIMSTSGVFGKLISLPPSYIIFLRCCIGTIFLYIFLKLTKKKLKIDLKNDWKFFAISGVLLAFHWVTYFYSIQISTVAIAFISLFTFPVITTLLEPFFRKTPFSFQNLISAVLVIIGIYFIVPDLNVGNNITMGAAFGVFSALLYAIRNLMNSKKLVKFQASTMMFYQLMVAGITLFPVLFMVDLEIGYTNLGYLLILGIVNSAIGQMMFTHSFKFFSASTASIISSFQPIYGIIIAFFLLGEVPEGNTIIGGTLIFLTVLYENIKPFLGRKRVLN